MCCEPGSRHWTRLVITEKISIQLTYRAIVRAVDSIQLLTASSAMVKTMTPEVIPRILGRMNKKVVFTDKY